jgi:hypothetical protein
MTQWIKIKLIGMPLMNNVFFYIGICLIVFGCNRQNINTLNFKEKLEQFNFLENKLRSINNPRDKREIIDSMNIYWKLFCNNKKQFIQFLKTQNSDSFNLTRIKIYLKDSFYVYVKGFTKINSSYYKDSFYSIYLTEAILREDYLFFQKPLTNTITSSRINVYLLLNKKSIFRIEDNYNLIQKNNIYIEESKNNLRILAKRLNEKNIDVLINNRSLLEKNDSFYWFSKNYDLKSKIDFNDSVNIQKYKLPKSLKNIRIDCW